MNVLRNLSELCGERGPVFLAIGFFDGIHHGHQRVLKRTIDKASRAGGTAWVLTFDPHPLKVLHPEVAPSLLTSTAHKLLLLQAVGVDGCVVMRFTRQLAALEPVRFVEQLAACMPPLSEVLVGRNWRFGRKGTGTPALLSKMGGAAGLRVTVVEAVQRGGKPVSSTRVREAVTAGRLGDVAKLLGRPFSVLGTVVHGHGVGRKIGYPTANLDPHGEALPPFGVYAVRARLTRGRERWGVLSIGVRPTFARGGHPKPSFELHLPGFRGNLYGQDIEVVFIRFIRSERRFESVEALKCEIENDIGIARRLASHG